MIKKRIFKVFAFLMILVVVTYGLCDLFESVNTTNHDRRFTLFREFSDDTVDAVILGTSGIDRYWVAAQAYEEYGMTVYPLASDSMPPWLFKNVVEEVYTHQNPELVIIDIRSFLQDNVTEETNNNMEIKARRVLDSMSLLSPNYIKTAFDSMKWIHKADNSISRFNMSLIFPFIKYHTKWADDDFSFSDNLGNKNHEYLGFYVNADNTITVKKQKSVKFNPNETQELDPISQEALYEFIDYVKEREINVLFLDTPQFRKQKVSKRANQVYSILEEEGMDYIHFYSEDSKNGFTIESLNAAKDFYNARHVNFYGAQKFTEHFAKYLDENYDFSDHRNDEKVKMHWDGVYAKLLKKINDYEKLASKE